MSLNVNITVMLCAKGFLISINNKQNEYVPTKEDLICFIASRFNVPVWLYPEERKKNTNIIRSEVDKMVKKELDEYNRKVCEASPANNQMRCKSNDVSETVAKLQNDRTNIIKVVNGHTIDIATMGKEISKIKDTITKLESVIDNMRPNLNRVKG